METASFSVRKNSSTIQRRPQRSKTRATSNFVAGATVAAVTAMQLVQALRGTTRVGLEDLLDPPTSRFSEPGRARTFEAEQLRGVHPWTLIHRGF
jgi:hypothetical protein